MMKTVYGKFKRMLSVLLATALVLTCVPQTGMQVFAAESDAEAVVSEDGHKTYAGFATGISKGCND